MYNTLDEFFASYDDSIDLKEGHPCIGPIQYHLSGEGGGDWYLNIDGVDIIAHKGVIENPVSICECIASDYLDLKNGKTTHTALLQSKKMVITKGGRNFLKLSTYFVRN